MKKTTDKAAKAERAERARAEAAAIREREGTDGLARAAWGARKDRPLLRALEAAAFEDPALQRSLSIVRWARDEGYVSDGRLHEEALEVAALGLALHGDPRVLPFVVGLAERHWAGTRLLEPWVDRREPHDEAALLACGRAWLANGSRPDLELGARIVHRYGDASDLALLEDGLDRVFAQFQQMMQGFESAMERGRLDETARLLALAVDARAPSVGGRKELRPSLIQVLEHVVANRESRWLDNVRGDAAWLLAQAGLGLEPLAARLLSSRFDRNTDPFRSGELLALGQLGGALADSDRKSALASALATLTFKHPLRNLAALVARRDLGESIADDTLSAAFHATLTPKPGEETSSTFVKGAVRALAILERRADLSPALAGDAVLGVSTVVHRAAVRALRVRGATIPRYRLLDPLSVDALAARGREALEAALSDETARYPANVIDALRTLGAPASCPALLAFVARASTRAVDDGAALEGAVAALAALGGADAALDRIAASADLDGPLTEAVLRSAPTLGLALAPTMARLFAKTEHRDRRTAAEWLSRHKRAPEVAAALAAHGLAIEDLRLLR